MIAKDSYSAAIKKEASRLGFEFCGISKADFLEEEAPLFERWLAQNMHGQMSYMANHFDKRLDPRKLVPGARSVISLLMNYYSNQRPSSGNPKVSMYAYGEDYHDVIREKLKELSVFIRENIGDISGRVFVDSAPVLERAWAKKSGLGWVGKNTNLINKGSGSYYFIAEIICDLELDADAPIGDYCGTCSRCIDACPTDAIIKPYVVDGSKCISYFTIELKEEIPLAARGKMDDWIFGCDVCQEVCPWNRFSKPNTEESFEPLPEIMNMDRRQWEEMTEDVFEKVFRRSPLRRTGYKGLSRNLAFIRKKPS